MKILVTGATGMVGSALVRQLLKNGETVRIFRRRNSNLMLIEDVSDQVEHFIGDITDPDAVSEAVSGVEVVYHTAAAIAFGGSSRALNLMQAVNVEGTRFVVDACVKAGVRRLIHTSSIAALGRNDNQKDKVYDETQVWEESPDNTDYAVSKHLAELEVYRGIAEGLDAVFVNPALIFGAGRPGENTVALIEKIANKKMPAYPIGGTCVVDVLDVVETHIKAMEIGETGERHIAGGDNLPWKELIETVATAFKVEPPKRPIPYSISMVAAYVSEKLSLLTGKDPLINRETIRLSSKTSRYNNRKATTELGVKFRSFKETAGRLAKMSFV